MDPLDIAVADQLKTDIPEFGPGDDVAVHFRVIEGDKLYNMWNSFKILLDPFMDSRPWTAI